jgi:hypothetical protein
MTRQALNVSFERRPIVFRLSSPHLLALDPLALDGMSAELQQVGNAPADQSPERLAALTSMLKIRSGVPRRLDPAAD